MVSHAERLSFPHLTDALLELTGLALLAGTNLPQISEGVNPGRVTVIPVELDRVMTDLRSSSNLDGSFSKHRKRIRISFYLGRLIPTGGAWATLAEVGVRISGLMAIVPGDGNAARRRKLDRGWDRIHEGDYPSMETVGTGA
jgi:hypothetical protein